MDIFYTDMTKLNHSDHARGLPESAVRRVLDLRVPEGIPFYVGGDGRYPDVINRFLRDLPAWGCRSANTCRAYALDLQSLLVDLAEVGSHQDLLRLEFDVKRYRDRRRNGSPPAVTASTMNRSIAAFEKFHAWAKAHGLRDLSPFKYRRGRPSPTAPSRWSTASTRR